MNQSQEAGINKRFAQTVGISVDHRRTNKSTESLTLNVQRLMDYKARLIVFPKTADKFKKGDSSKEEIADAEQLKGEIMPTKPDMDAITFTKISEVWTIYSTMSTRDSS